jgi:hypothetical protein
MEDSDDDLGPEDDDAWLFEDLNLLLKLWTKRREKEGLLALIFEVSPLIEIWFWGADYSGSHCRIAQGYHYDILCSSRYRLQGCFDCRLLGRLAELYERHD